ncbi:MAG: molybdate ABC transporter substrate-binding protein [Betaproteobacteria bacterium]|nr:molybdate ABC transporter substrate-binding protein [Betaproteobacteria bacterium]
MKLRSFVAPAITGIVLSLTQGIAVEAAEVKVIAGGAFAPALRELGPQFERTTGHKLVIQYGILGTIKQQIEGGEEFDLVIVPAALLDGAAKQGKIAAGTRTEIARVGMAVAARAGSPKPDISSVDAFKGALLGAKSVTFPPEGAVGVHLAKVFDRLGIVEEMKAKTKPQKNIEHVPQAVAAGEAELGFAPSTVLVSAGGVELVGPFPPELQTYIVFTMGVGSAARQPDAAKALINYLTTPDAVAVIRAKGFEPAPSRQ